MITTTAAKTLTRTSNLAALIDLYRHHAKLARRMVARRNHAAVAAGGRYPSIDAARWNTRSFTAYEGHMTMVHAVRERLHEIGHADLALALQQEDTAYRRRSWRVISGDRVSPEIRYTISRTRQVIAAIRDGLPRWRCGDDMHHVAHVWNRRIDPATNWLCTGR